MKQVVEDNVDLKKVVNEIQNEKVQLENDILQLRNQLREAQNQLSEKFIKEEEVKAQDEVVLGW